MLADARAGYLKLDWPEAVHFATGLGAPGCPLVVFGGHPVWVQTGQVESLLGAHGVNRA
jgi:hypothetical protein